jgi:acyl-CoA oxidase
VTASSVASLTRLLDGSQADARERVRKLLAEPGLAPPVGLETDAHRHRVLGQLERLANEGLGRLGLPESADGDDDPAAALAVVQILGHGDLSLTVAFGVQFGLFAGSILGLGTGDHHERFLPGCGRFETTGCFAMTETGHGSNIRDLETVARYEPADEAFVLQTPHAAATKDYIANALFARWAVVFARLVVAGDDRGLHPFVVALRDDEGRLLPGRRIDDCGAKAGLHGVGNGRITFDAVRLPRQALLDRFGAIDAEGRYSSPFSGPGGRFAAMLVALLPGRVAVAGAAVSAAETALGIAIRYGEQRRQFGPAGRPEQPILDYLTHQRRLLPALAETYALHLAVRRAGDEALSSFEEGKTGDDRRRTDALVAAVKVAATRQAVAVAQECREACGGRGYLADMRLGAIRADVDVFTTFEGDNTVLLQLIARSLLTDIRAEFEAGARRDVVRHLARPLTVRMATAGGLRHPVGALRFQLDALRWRERHLVATLGLRVRRGIAAGQDPEDAFLAAQDNAVEAAGAHVDRVVLESFAAAVDACSDEWRPVLASLCRLHGLVRLEAAAAWLLEHHYLAPSQARRLRPAINRLCGELRPHARDLVDAFAIPDAVLGPAAMLGSS